MTYDIAFHKPPMEETGRWWFHAECAEHGWHTDHDLVWETAAFDAEQHGALRGCAPVLLRTRVTPGRRPPQILRVDKRVAAPGEQTFWAKCGYCSWGTRPEKTRLRSHRFADEHHNATGHAVDVLTKSGLNLRAVAPILTRHDTGWRNDTLF